MKNKINIQELIELIEEYKKTNNETVELKVNLIDDLIKRIEEDEIKVQILLVQKYNLILVLKEKGMKSDEILKILNVKE